jgi:hypothetical protein
VVVTGAIEPCPIVKGGHIDDERLALPATVGPSHPTFVRGLRRCPHVDDTNRVRVLVRNQNLLLGLDNLKGIRKIGRAWHTREVTLGLRVERRPVRLILLLLGSRCRQIGNLIAFDDAQAWRHDEHRSERGNRTLRRGVPLKIPIRCVEGLPDPVQVGSSVRRPRRPVRRRLRSSQGRGKHKSNGCRDARDRRVAKPLSHRTGSGGFFWRVMVYANQGDVNDPRERTASESARANGRA